MEIIGSRMKGEKKVKLCIYDKIIFVVLNILKI